MGLLVGGVALWRHYFHTYTPIEVAQDIRAGIKSRNAPEPVERFLELRYGPLNESTNRQRAFLDFFNADHVEGLHVLTSHMQSQEQRTNVVAMAQWLAAYRAKMSPEEKKALSDFFGSAAGREALRRATAQYLKQDARERAATAPVIKELMATLTALQQK